jgi:hypothetical protein
MEYARATAIDMKKSLAINEAWVQAQIVQDPAILGLGNLEILDKERRQPRAGRLDLLLWDEASETRYTVEIQLGATDESHIIRTIEYWDIERNRYPQINHVAVIVAEDVTSRFLNVISLFNKSVPIIAIQLNAFQVENLFTLASVKVLDTVEIASIEEDEFASATDRNYWLKERASQLSMDLFDSCIEIAKEFAPAALPNYRKRYIGLNVNGIVDNFVAFRPRKGDSMLFECKIPYSEEMANYIDESGFDQLTYSRRWNYFKMSIKTEDLLVRKENLRYLIGESFKHARS